MATWTGVESIDGFPCRRLEREVWREQIASDHTPRERWEWEHGRVEDYFTSDGEDAAEDDRARLRQGR